MQAATGADPQRTGPWLPATRVIWLLLSLATIGLWILGSYHLLSKPLANCAAVACDNLEFSAGDLKVMADLGLSARLLVPPLIAFHISYSLVFFVVAGILFWRKSDDRMALLISYALVYLGAVLFTSSDDALRRATEAASLPLTIVDLLGIAAAVLTFYLFPNGRFVPRLAWIPGAALFLLVMSVPLVSVSSTRLRGAAIDPVAELLWLSAFALTLIVGLASQVYRYRKVSGPIEKLQTKWVLFGLVGSISVVAVWSFIGFAYPPDQPSPTRIYVIAAGLLAIAGLAALLPLTIAFSILRYRLFAIDNLINRTLVYGLLTGSLALIYLAGVVLLQRVFPASSQIATVISTLLIAALFSPLRRRIQLTIDRRFYRRKYDAEKTVAAFGTAVRHEVGLQRLAEDLSEVVVDTFEPAHLSLWLQDAEAEKGGPRV